MLRLTIFVLALWVVMGTWEGLDRAFNNDGSALLYFFITGIALFALYGLARETADAGRDKQDQPDGETEGSAIGSQPSRMQR